MADTTTDMTSFKHVLSKDSFDWSNVPNGNQSISSPMQLKYSGPLASEDAWARIQTLFKEYHIPYTGVVDILIEGQRHSFTYPGHTQQAT